MTLKKQGLYLPDFEHDNCGAGFICSLKGKKSNDIIHKALEILDKLEHRGAVSADGKTLYFSSNMPEGFGGFDIYKAPINDDGTLGEAENLGQKVNTEGQEMFPYISSDNTLYFSSTGHLGLGGMDVFHTKEIDGKMAPIRNAGTPINSNGDDFAFRMNEETGEGFVSSKREGGKGSDDIYAIKKLQPLCDV